MDPKPPPGMILAPSAPGMALQMPGREARSRDRVPSPDDHLVAPEVTRDEVIRGRHVVAMPALPAHADRQFELGFVLRAHVKPGYVGSADLLTRVLAGSDFATDLCVRKEGNDPATGTRYLEELSFEVVNEQSGRDIREKAEDLTARGVRRVIAVFVKTGKVCQWSPGKAAWEALDLDGVLDDPCLQRPLRLRALLDAAEADDAVARALAEKRNPVIEGLQAERFAAGRGEGLVEAKAGAILVVLAARGLAVPEEVRAHLLACRDVATLDRWLAVAALAASAAEVVAADA
jgi:Putative restriction endonuclease